MDKGKSHFNPSTVNPVPLRTGPLYEIELFGYLESEQVSPERLAEKLRGCCLSCRLSLGKEALDTIPVDDGRVLYRLGDGIVFESVSKTWRLSLVFEETDEREESPDWSAYLEWLSKLLWQTTTNADLRPIVLLYGHELLWIPTEDELLAGNLSFLAERCGALIWICHQG